VTGEGPSFRRSGRLILYDPDDLDSWAKARLTAPLRSTSEIRKAPIPQEMESLVQPQLTGPSPVVRRPRGRPRKIVKDPLAEPAASTPSMPALPDKDRIARQSTSMKGPLNAKGP
jgi:hypothetical protein